ncbi:MAG: hypothetical protein ACPHLK_01615 [Gammaproteobacteria bacterium]|jgi:hypothetical protein
MTENDKTPEEKDIAAKNMRLAIILGLVAIGFYIAVFFKFM